MRDVHVSRGCERQCVPVTTGYLSDHVALEEEVRGEGWGWGVCGAEVVSEV